MIENIKATLSDVYFPTSQFENDFGDEDFKELQYLFEEIKGEIENILPTGRYSVSTNLGRGEIAFFPWIGVHSINPNFDSSSNKGFYLTILWKYDGSGVCLSFQTGTDGIQGGEKAVRIKTAVDLIRSKYGTGGFEKSIDLEYHRGRPKAYEQAHIAGREYDFNELVNLHSDLLQIENLYNDVVNDNPRLVLDKQGTSGKVLSKDSFEPTYDRETLEGRTDDLLSLPEFEQAQGNQNPGQKLIETTQFERDPAVRAGVLKRANGICELCNNDAPFKKANGNPFLEVHHAVPLGKGGPDTIDNAFALCPNCHREAHYGEYRAEIEKMLISGLNRETIEQNLKTDQRPKRAHGGFGQWIAERFGHDFDNQPPLRL